MVRSRANLHFEQLGSDLDAHERAEQQLVFRRHLGGWHQIIRGGHLWVGLHLVDLHLDEFGRHLDGDRRPLRVVDGHRLFGGWQPTPGR